MVFEHHLAKPYDFIGKCIINNYSAVTVRAQTKVELDRAGAHVLSGSDQRAAIERNLNLGKLECSAAIFSEDMSICEASGNC